MPDELVPLLDPPPDADDAVDFEGLSASASEPAGVRKTPSRLSRLLRELVEAVVLAGLLFLVLQAVVQNTVVEGPSMEPSFHNSERIIVNKLAYLSHDVGIGGWSLPIHFGEPERGDVVVFRPDETQGAVLSPNGDEPSDFIKRVVALPGETVEIHGGQVFIDGQVLDEPWLTVADSGEFGAFVVGDDQYFVLGDNRPVSNDSRRWSQAIHRDQIVGKAWLRLWPPGTTGIVSANGHGGEQ
jgi:signal peptidase I